jgi:hypothetical protein
LAADRIFILRRERNSWQLKRGRLAADHRQVTARPLSAGPSSARAAKREKQGVGILYNALMTVGIFYNVSHDFGKTVGIFYTWV